MKKYKVLRDCCYGKVGVEFCSEELAFIMFLVEYKWLAEVPEEKELWEKFSYLAGEDRDTVIVSTLAKRLAKIARQHFAEVARKVRDSWYTDRHSMVICDQIIQAIESDGEA